MHVAVGEEIQQKNITDRAARPMRLAYEWCGRIMMPAVTQHAGGHRSRVGHPQSGCDCHLYVWLYYRTPEAHTRQLSSTTSGVVVPQHTGGHTPGQGGSHSGAGTSSETGEEEYTPPFWYCINRSKRPPLDTFEEKFKSPPEHSEGDKLEAATSKSADLFTDENFQNSEDRGQAHTPQLCCRLATTKPINQWKLKG